MSDDFHIEALLRRAEARLEGQPLTDAELAQLDQEAQEHAWACALEREQSDDELAVYGRQPTEGTTDVEDYEGI